MKTILFILLALLPNYRSCLQIDIILLADFSGSVVGHEITIHKAIDSFISRFELSESGVKIGVILFSDNTTILSPLTADKNSISYNKLPLGSGSTFISKGLQESVN